MGCEKMAFAENLKTAREKKQISQYELAEMVGLTQTAIAYFELGTRQPNIYNGVQIAKALGTTAEILIDGDTATDNSVTGWGKKMEPKVTWKKMCYMQVKSLVKSAVKIYGCTEEQAYEVVFKGLCSYTMYKLADELLRKNNE